MSVGEALFRGLNPVRVPPPHLSYPWTVRAELTLSASCVVPISCPLGADRWQNDVDTQLYTSFNACLSLALQIEFVTGTKKGTTTNAAAATTATASTAVAGRRRLRFPAAPQTERGLPSLVLGNRAWPRCGLC